MQTNALSRHKMPVALMAEPKTPLESSVFYNIAVAFLSAVRLHYYLLFHTPRKVQRTREKKEKR